MIIGSAGDPGPATAARSRQALWPLLVKAATLFQPADVSRQ